MKYLMSGATALLLLALTLSRAVSAQESAPPQSICLEDPGFAQFDFWLGEWDVYDNASGKHAGVNRIEKHEKGCLIMEHWTSDGGGTGRSMNYYDAVTKKWRQVWVAGGYSIDYTGGLNEAGEMVLTGEIHGYRSGKSTPFRGTWTANEDGSVRQFFEQFNAEKDSWDVWFDGKYVQRSN